MDELTKYISLLIISYLGLAIGVIISHIVKEELKPGKRYFLLLRPIIFAVVFIHFMIYLKINLVISTIISIIPGLVMYFWDWRIKFVNSDMLFYAFFSVILFETRLSRYAPIISILIFIFGLLTSAIRFNKELSVFFNLRKTLGENIVYMILGLLLVFVFRT